MRDMLHENGCRLRIARSRRVSIYLGQIMIIRSGRTPKFSKERTREGWDISMHDKLLGKGCRLRIARNHMGSVFRLNNEY